MDQKGKPVNLVLGGGGVKGIAYIGVFEAAERKKLIIGNIAGVSAGALSGVYAGAGFTSRQLGKIMDEFNFEKIEVEKIQKKIPAVEHYMQYVKGIKTSRGIDNRRRDYVSDFLNTRFADVRGRYSNYMEDYSELRGNMFNNIISFGKEGCLFDGDYLEEWVSKVLLRKGVKTFGDLRGGIKDKVNPKGYKVRMTAVDANRGRVIVLPDDIAFYGIDPDRFEVAKAVRMSTSVPFAFKPVEIKKLEGNKVKTYHIVDGGVLDNLPLWICESTDNFNTIGFRFKGKNENSLLSMETPLNVLKALISKVHDFGIPKQKLKNSFIVDIDTTKVSSLDFNISEQEKKYLYSSGKKSAFVFFNKYTNAQLKRSGTFFEQLLSFFRGWRS